MASTSRLSTAAQFFEDDGGGSEAISTYDRVSLNKIYAPVTRSRLYLGLDLDIS